MSLSLHPFYSKSAVKTSHMSSLHWVTGYKYIITSSLKVDWCLSENEVLNLHVTVNMAS